jgi:hypothetical protein
VFRLDILKDAVDVYLDLKDQDAALKTIGDGTKLAEELYAKDKDSSVPNLALKALWPSTNVWRQFVGLAARISPDVATKLIDAVTGLRDILPASGPGEFTRGSRTKNGTLSEAQPRARNKENLVKARSHFSGDMFFVFGKFEFVARIRREEPCTVEHGYSHIRQHQFRPAGALWPDYCRKAISPLRIADEAGALGKVEMPPPLWDFQAEWEIPAVGFSTERLFR